ncbi:18522_t:CDS:2 [Rhizophagus irregularis]|nr:18522_t:CDS:2 [Rhizophagus irregularis]
MDSRERVAQLLYANVQNNANPNPPAVTAALNQVQPLAPPTLTPLDLLTANIINYRNWQQFDGMKVYKYACMLRAQNQRLSYPFHTITHIAVQLWNNSEPDNIKQVYRDIAEETAPLEDVCAHINVALFK